MRCVDAARDFGGGDAVCAGALLGSRSTRACARCSGDEAACAVLSDDREGEESEGWMLPCEPVHGGLERAARAA
jgi:hypothetical protein